METNLPLFSFKNGKSNEKKEEEKTKKLDEETKDDAEKSCKQEQKEPHEPMEVDQAAGGKTAQ